ncbi:MAG: hypothetical protein QM630_06330 [Microbacterium sp.]
MTLRIPTALVGILLVAALSACATTEASPTPEATRTPAAPEPEATVEPVPSETPDPPVDEELACDTIITDGTVAALTDLGWTPQRQDFVIGDIALPEGMLCFWADYTVATDHGQLYGWAAISAEDAATAQTSLLASGWTRQNGPEGSYFTEDAQFSLGTDSDGYGMTYLFGDGWVKLADTKQGLILIDWAG